MTEAVPGSSRGISEVRAVLEAASQRGVSRQTVHRSLARYEVDGLEGLPDRSYRPERCPQGSTMSLVVGDGHSD